MYFIANLYKANDKSHESLHRCEVTTYYLPPLARSPSPLAQESRRVLVRSVSSQNHAISASPPSLWGKWRVQRADRGAPAARGFVCGACEVFHWIPHIERVSMPLAALFVVHRRIVKAVLSTGLFQCCSRLCLWCIGERRHYGCLYKIVSMPLAALFVVH